MVTGERGASGICIRVNEDETWWECDVKGFSSRFNAISHSGLQCTV